MAASSALTNDINFRTEERFNAAVNVIKNLPQKSNFQLSTDMLLRFYGLYKQATEGPCRSVAPNMWWDIKGYKKWQGWSSLADMPQHQAMAEYVNELKQIVETMSLTIPVGDFLDKLGSFYEIVQSETPAVFDGVSANGDANGWSGPSSSDISEEEDESMLHAHTTVPKKTDLNLSGMPADIRRDAVPGSISANIHVARQVVRSVSTTTPNVSISHSPLHDIASIKPVISLHDSAGDYFKTSEVNEKHSTMSASSLYADNVIASHAGQESFFPAPLARNNAYDSDCSTTEFHDAEDMNNEAGVTADFVVQNELTVSKDRQRSRGGKYVIHDNKKTFPAPPAASELVVLSRLVESVDSSNQQIKQEVHILHDDVRKLLTRLERIEAAKASAVEIPLDKHRSAVSGSFIETPRNVPLHLTGNLRCDVMNIVDFILTNRRCRWVLLLIWPVVVHVVLFVISKLRRR